MNSDTPFSEIVDAPEFEAAWSAVIERPITFAEFSKLPMPAGMDPRRLWVTFARLRRHMGETLDLVPWFRGPYGGVSWYALSKQEEKRLVDLASLAAPDSHLNELVGVKSIGGLSLSAHLVDEIASLARFDGLTLTVDQIREIWLQQRKASSPQERIIENAVHVFADANKFRGRRFSRMLIDDIHEMLVDRVGELELTSMQMFRRDLYNDELMQDEDYQSDVADCIVRYARSTHTVQDVVMRCALISFYLWDMQPYPSMNRLTEFLVRRVYLVHNRMPALSFARFSCNMELSTRAYTLTHEVEASASASEGLDATWLFAGAIEAFLSETRELESLARRLEQEQRHFRMQLQNTPNLNDRQRSFLVAMQRTRKTDFTINEYQQYFHVAYATARSDMFELVELGVLSQSKVGKAFVFQLRLEPGSAARS